MADADARVRNLAIALGVSTGLLFWGVIAREWFTSADGNIGLVGLEVCNPFCELRFWNDLGAATEITVLGFTAFLFGLKAAVLATHAFAMVLKREPARIRWRWLTASAAITVLAAAAFLVRLLRESVALSYPGFFAIAGGLGVLAVLYVVRR